MASLKLEIATELTTCSLCGGTIQKNERFWSNHGLSEHTNCEIPKPIARGDQSKPTEMYNNNSIMRPMSDSL